MVLISIISMIFAGFSNALMDISSENRFKKNKFNKNKGDNNDENKWKQPLEKGERKWWYLWILHKPRYKEAYIWSSTILVSTTDWWHRFQSIMLFFFALSVVSYVPITTSLISYWGWKTFMIPILDFIIFRILFNVSFEILYTYLKNKLDGKL